MVQDWADLAADLARFYGQGRKAVEDGSQGRSEQDLGSLKVGPREPVAQPQATTLPQTGELTGWTGSAVGSMLTSRREILSRETVWGIPCCLSPRTSKLRLPQCTLLSQSHYHQPAIDKRTFVSRFRTAENSPHHSFEFSS